MPHGFHLGRVGPTKSVEGADGDPVCRSDRCHHLGVGLGIERVQAGFGFFFRGHDAVPIGGLWRFVSIGNRYIGDGCDGKAALGQSLTEERRAQIEQ